MILLITPIIVFKKIFLIKEPLIGIVLLFWELQSCKVYGLGFRQQKVKIGSMVKNINYFQMFRPNSEFSVSLGFFLFHCQKNTRPV